MTRRLDLSCHGCRSHAHEAAAHNCGQGAASGTEWGWSSDSQPGHVTWAGGTLADSYARVSAHGGQWILVTSAPIESYRAVMAQVAQAAS